MVSHWCFWFRESHISTHMLASASVLMQWKVFWNKNTHNKKSNSWQEVLKEFVSVPTGASCNSNHWCWCACMRDGGRAVLRSSKHSWWRHVKVEVQLYMYKMYLWCWKTIQAWVSKYILHHKRGGQGQTSNSCTSQTPGSHPGEVEWKQIPEHHELQV